MSLISSNAIIHPTAELAEGVEVGPWTLIGANVKIGAGSVIHAHVVIKGPTVIGKNNRIFQFSTIGED
ncbi:MAG: acyl-[acyl-carrier-protein]--UDP-N-acetylglucosamine O-acyltransferase, partial [Porticoccus sp.]